MKKIHFTKTINASPQKTYRTMLGLDSKETYGQWTATFNPTSTYEGSWDEGERIRFIGTNDQGKREGMISEIAENLPNQFVSIRHFGILDGDKEITSGEKVEGWAGALENYGFEAKNGGTLVTVEMDTADAYLDYFKEAWPKALQQLKEVVEKA